MAISLSNLAPSFASSGAYVLIALILIAVLCLFKAKGLKVMLLVAAGWLIAVNELDFLWTSRSLLQLFGSFILLIVIGYIFKRAGLVNEEDAKLLNKFLINVPMAIIVFIAVKNITGFANLIVVPVLYWAIFFAALSGGFILSTILLFDRPTKGAFLLNIMNANTGFLGIPIILALYGQSGMQVLTMIILAMTILLPSVVNIVTTFFGKGEKTSAREIIKGILLFPIFIAFAIGIAFNFLSIAIPINIETSMLNFGAIATPLILFSLGVLIEFEKPKGIGALFLTALVKLVAYPLIAYYLATMLGFSGFILKTIVVAAALPPGFSNIAWAVEKNLDLDTTKNAVFYLTLISMITIPIIAHLFG